MIVYVVYVCVEENGCMWDDLVIIVVDDVYVVVDDEMCMGLVFGEIIILVCLLEGLMVVFGNDVVLVIVCYLDGLQVVFLECMNWYVCQFGLCSIWFVSVFGIIILYYVFSVCDMVVLVVCLLNDYLQILVIIVQCVFVYGSFNCSNQNVLFGEDGVDGLKIGYIQVVGFCLVVIVCWVVFGWDQLVCLIIVVLGFVSCDVCDVLVCDQLVVGFVVLVGG